MGAHSPSVEMLKNGLSTPIDHGFVFEPLALTGCRTGLPASRAARRIQESSWRDELIGGIHLEGGAVERGIVSSGGWRNPPSWHQLRWQLSTEELIITSFNKHGAVIIECLSNFPVANIALANRRARSVLSNMRVIIFIIMVGLPKVRLAVDEQLMVISSDYRGAKLKALVEWRRLIKLGAAHLLV